MYASYKGVYSRHRSTFFACEHMVLSVSKDVCKSETDNHRFAAHETALGLLAFWLPVLIFFSDR